MLAAAVLVTAALLSGGPALPPPVPIAVRAVPEEPGAVVLSDRPTYQAVVADLDADGSRELIRLVTGERGSILAEAWTWSGRAWVEAATAVEVVPTRPSVGQGDVVWLGAPVRLLVRTVDGSERVSVIRQPQFQEPGIEIECCLLINDLVMVDGALSLPTVAAPIDSVGAVSVIDLDGDGTDELLASRSLPPLGDISYPSEALVFRWAGSAFGPPTLSRLEVGSGDSPFVIGDSDGRPGEEAAIISTLGRPGLFRLALRGDDMLMVEDAGLVATDALAVPLGDGRGLAVIRPTTGVAIVRWPAGEAAQAPTADLPLDEATILGVVDHTDAPTLAVLQRDPGALHLLDLPDLTPARGASVTRSPAAATFAASPLTPYVGRLPGGGVDGESVVIYAGRMVPSEDLPDAPFATLGTAVVATLAGVVPVGLLGPDRGWMAIHHAPLAFGQPSPRGGRLDAPVFQPGSAVSLAPLGTVRTAEADDGVLDPELQGATRLPGGRMGTAPEGFVAVIDAPPGSRVYLADADPSVVGPVQVVGATGRAHVVVSQAALEIPNPAFRVSLSVVTPAGHGYVAGWDVRVLNEPPPLEVEVSTPFGSSSVTVTGRTAPYAEVQVAGTPVEVLDDGRFRTTVAIPPWPTAIEVTAADPVGNVATATTSGVGVFDYRGLPWLLISVALVAAAAVALFLRVPRPPRAERRAGDDAVLEELEPD